MALELVFNGDNKVSISRKRELSTVRIGFDKIFWKRSMFERILIVLLNMVVIFTIANTIFTFWAVVYALMTYGLIAVSYISEKVYYVFIIDFLENKIFKEKYRFRNLPKTETVVQKINKVQFNFQSFTSKGKEKFLFSYRKVSFGVVDVIQKDELENFLGVNKLASDF